VAVVRWQTVPLALKVFLPPTAGRLITRTKTKQVQTTKDDEEKYRGSNDVSRRGC
jgi:hypothetical protein